MLRNHVIIDLTQPDEFDFALAEEMVEKAFLKAAGGNEEEAYCGMRGLVRASLEEEFQQMLDQAPDYFILTLVTSLILLLPEILPSALQIVKNSHELYNAPCID